jgi:hypothetical protein
MKRRLLNLLTALSLLLCVAAAVLCVLRVEGMYVVRHGGGGIAGGSDVATVALFIQRGRVGLGWTHSDVWFERYLQFPLWLAALLTAVLPGWWVVRDMLPRRTAAAAACRSCGYDLTANLSGVCPECGVPAR